MLQIIGIIIVVSIVISIISSIADAVGGYKVLFGIIAAIVAFIVLVVNIGWESTLEIAGVVLLVVAIIFVILKMLKALKEHDASKKKLQEEKNRNAHESELIKELKENCMMLGNMTSGKWIEKLPNYAFREYKTSFESITQNFAQQIEQQYILQNDDWFDVYKRYIVEHDGGVTVTKMLSEVICPQLKMTHVTPDRELLNKHLKAGTEKKSMDVPPLFNVVYIDNVGENLYTPTEYLKKRYNMDNSQQVISHSEEFDFDSL